MTHTSPLVFEATITSRKGVEFKLGPFRSHGLWFWWDLVKCFPPLFKACKHLVLWRDLNFDSIEPDGIVMTSWAELKHWVKTGKKGMGA